MCPFAVRYMNFQLQSFIIHSEYFGRYRHSADNYFFACHYGRFFNPVIFGK